MEYNFRNYAIWWQMSKSTNVIVYILLVNLQNFAYS